jgi:3-deoxy-D-manno-octulosonic-acid transferase
MLTLLYSIMIHLFYLIVLIASPFNRKARLWVNGRTHWRKMLRQWQHAGTYTVWFHAASLGEFEQGRPLIEEIRKLIPDCSLILTFYSPSGFEIRKNYQEADQVCYLPLDTRYNAREFLKLVKPDAVFFIKYEFWNFYLRQLHNSNIPLYLISGIFRPRQIFFRWYGSWFRKKLACFTHFFLQDEVSSNLLGSIGFQNTTVTGDTRFDRVTTIAARAKIIEIAAAFSNNSFCIVAGSTWPADEDLLTPFINETRTNIKFIIAPHEIDMPRISRLTARIKKKFMLYSLSSVQNAADNQVLIIDNIGMLSSLYRYGQLAYIGGGFGKGIHNILEAAVFGIPVIFGPNYSKSREAGEMIESGGAFSAGTPGELNKILTHLLNSNEAIRRASGQAGDFIKNNTGATKQIIRQVLKALQLQS